MLDFDRIKGIPFDEVLKLYGVQFTDTKGGLSSICPLPGHPQGERKKTFSVRLPENYFRCWSAKCNEASGGKRGGDVIAFVALMDGTNQGDAAKKLQAHFIGESKTPATHGREGSGAPAQIEPSRTDAIGDNTSSNGSSKGYMKEIETWLVGLLPKRDGETDGEWFRRVSKEIKQRLYASYLAGKAATAAVPPKQ